MQRKQNILQCYERSHSHSWEQNGSTAPSGRQIAGHRWGSICKESRASDSESLPSSKMSSQPLPTLHHKVDGSFPTKQPRKLVLSYPWPLHLPSPLSGEESNKIWIERLFSHLAIPKWTVLLKDEGVYSLLYSEIGVKGHKELKCSVQFLSLANVCFLTETLQGKGKRRKGRKLGRRNSRVVVAAQKLRAEIRKPKEEMDASFFLLSYSPNF